jgi:hypothetical protein
VSPNASMPPPTDGDHHLRRRRQRDDNHGCTGSVECLQLRRAGSARVRRGGHRHSERSTDTAYDLIDGVTTVTDRSATRPFTTTMRWAARVGDGGANVPNCRGRRRSPTTPSTASLRRLTDLANEPQHRAHGLRLRCVGPSRVRDGSSQRPRAADDHHGLRPGDQCLRVIDGSTTLPASATTRWDA